MANLLPAKIVPEPLDVDRLMAASCIGHLDYHTELDSTNDRALQLAARTDLVRPFLVVAERQLAGRGRGGNRWWSADGALTFSVVLRADTVHTPLQRSCRMSLGTALAVRDAIGEALPNNPVRLKWPNDVYLLDRKVSGILVETTPARNGTLVIGIGVNVNNSLRDAPSEVQAKATSLLDVAGHTFDRTELLLHVLRRLAHVVQELCSDLFPLSDRWRAACMLQGRTVCLEAGGHPTIGVCQGIDNEGALLLQTDAGVRRCLTGVVTGVV